MEEKKIKLKSLCTTKDNNPKTKMSYRLTVNISQYSYDTGWYQRYVKHWQNFIKINSTKPIKTVEKVMN